MIFLIGPIIPIPNLFYLGKETIFSQQRSQCFVLIFLQAAALPSHPQDSKLEFSTQILCTLMNLCKVGAWMTPSYKAEPLLYEGKYLIWDEESNPSIKGDIFHPGRRNENSLHMCGPIWQQSSSWNRQREPIVITWAANLQQKKNQSGSLQPAGIFVCYGEGKTEQEISKESLKQEIKKAPLTMHTDWEGGKAGLST